MTSRMFDKKAAVVLIGFLIICCIAACFGNRKIQELSRNRGNSTDITQGEIKVEKKAPEKFKTEDGFEYYVIPKGDIEVISITRYTGTKKQLTIPEEIDDMQVEIIGDSAFTYCEGLKKVEVPECIGAIGNSAFGGCRKLKEVVIRGADTAIGGSCFVECPKELVLYCIKDSKAEKYAKSEQVTYEILGE